MARLKKISLKCDNGTGEKVEVKCFNQRVLGPKTMTTGQQDECSMNKSFNPQAPVTLVISKAGLPNQNRIMNVLESPDVQSQNFQMLAAKYTLTCRVD